MKCQNNFNYKKICLIVNDIVNVFYLSYNEYVILNDNDNDNDNFYS